MKNQLRDLVLGRLTTRHKRRILIIESDDWGTIRMPSSSVYQMLLSKGYPVDKCPYNRNDSLETDADMLALIEVLRSAKDHTGRPAVITANWIAANPDFDRIRDSGFQEYFWEPSNSTLERHPDSRQVFALQKQALTERLFYPQFHGREHVHVAAWMKKLRAGDEAIRLAFNHRMISFNVNEVPSCESDIMDAYNAGDTNDLKFSEASVTEGLKLFQETWGFASTTAIPPCYFWHEAHEQVMYNNGVMGIQGIAVQKSPVVGKEKWKKKYHWTGQRNKNGQIYLRRNVFFEPSILGREGAVSSAFAGIARAFEKGHAAIISSHRLNYIGTINPENRTSNLKLLKELLQLVVSKFPEVEFMHSADYLEFIRKP
ncbi:MAG TPA: hypothetical protein PKX04_07635 [Chitinophagales bacterium]|nr:hypothetical protein [Chitinophagales bacterium]HPE97812.1 hypothetical protein [Chitinophagales bacterium]HQU39027.1 hypothetical protein [Chitinophagales bacterium]